MSEVVIGVSVASMWQRFHGCDPDYIRTTCKGRCCDAPGKPGGTMIVIHRNEQAAIEARGGTVRDGILDTGTRGKCTFKTDDSLCGLHFTPDKPFKCIASPFTLAPGGKTLIVRNRYRSLVCFENVSARRGDDTSDFLPAYIAFRAGLDLIFGVDTAAWLVDVLEVWGDPKAPGYAGPKSVPLPVSAEVWSTLADNDHTIKAAIEKIPLPGSL